MDTTDPGAGHCPEILIVSGGVGASAEQLVYTVLAQFPNRCVPITTLGNIRHPEQVQEVLNLAKEKNALIVHTMVDSAMRQYLRTAAEALNLTAVDLMGGVMEWLSDQLAVKPLEEPGLYRRLNRAYFERVSSIEFTMAHDDGKSPEGWKNADLLLLGVSRVGKTPLSLYLAVLGWKVANMPIVPGIALPDELRQQERSKMLGLTISADQVLTYRLQRQARLGVVGPSAYIDPEEIYQEIKDANRLFNRLGVDVMDMTDMTIEMAADEIVRRLTGGVDPACR